MLENPETGPIIIIIASRKTLINTYTTKAHRGTNDTTVINHSNKTKQNTTARSIHRTTHTHIITKTKNHHTKHFDIKHQQQQTQQIHKNAYQQQHENQKQ